MEHTNILDEENGGVAQLYCDKSLRFLSYSLIFLIVGVLIAMTTNYFGLLMSLSLTLEGVPIIAVLMMAGMGIWYAIQSIRVREEEPVKQFLGLSGNLVLLTMFFLVFYALVPSASNISMPREEMPTPPQEIINDLPLIDTIQ